MDLALPSVPENQRTETELHKMTEEEWSKLDHRSQTDLYNQALRDPKTIAVLNRQRAKWFNLPPKMRSNIIEQQQKNFSIIFCVAFEQNNSEVMDQLLPRRWAHKLELACKDALGEDITLAAVGSLTRGTAADQDSDVDLEVRYKDNRANESFTEEDKVKVNRSLQDLRGVSGLDMGNVSIKFVIPGGRPWAPTRVDLVLFRPRPDEFPCLRGGEDFYRNSARINPVFEKYPAANAVKGVKTFFP